jgi:hypothetical protein
VPGTKKAIIEIKHTDVAELVDARDLKFSAPLKTKAVFWKTPANFLSEPARTSVKHELIGDVRGTV